ncbi:MAG: type II secretion system protein [Campylobacter sp.]|uniref:type II secretion system protein n=1 Tax=Campylobacter sp. TaxID=205 RepID=UPI002A83CEBD|nr:type II secretion system protein [Campylobacter sp.]MDY5116112.1 type II secretion system protein [Campylobacter sp.]
MKKGFTMIELIFVIVILGILASVAIPRLAATREDAEISAAVANLRTLVSDATAYYTAKGTLTGANWSAITNVPLKKDTNGNAVDSTTTATTKAYLKVGNDNNCIDVEMKDRDNNNKAAHIKFTKKTSPTGVCQQVLNSDPLKPYFNNNGEMPIGSSTSVYTSTPAAQGRTQR